MGLEANQFVTLIKKFELAYENKDFKLSQQATSEWYKFFKDYTVEQLKIAYQEHVKNEMFIPTIASILKYVKQTARQNIMSSEEMLLIIKRANSKHSYTYETEKFIEYVGEIGNETIKEVARLFVNDLKTAPDEKSMSFIKNNMKKKYDDLIEKGFVGKTNYYTAIENLEDIKMIGGIEND